MQITPSVHNNYNVRNVSAQKSPNFTSKSAIIRQLSDISMRTRREFPLMSNTVMDRFASIGRSGWKIYRYTENLIGEIRGFAVQEPEKGKKLLRLLDASKELSVGNCSEYAEATCVACKLNGFEDAKVLSLYAYNPQTKKIRTLDHALVGINFNKTADIESNAIKPLYMRNNDAIIVDTWAGVTDYERNMTSIYKNDRFFGKNLKPDEVICYIESGEASNVSRDDLLFLQHKYPTIASKKRSPLKDILRWWVIDKEQFEFEPIPQRIKETYRHTIDMKRAMTRNELTECFTRDAIESAENKKIARRQKRERENSAMYKIRKKMQAIGQKFFK